jgi:hypothetical protein
MNEVKAMAARAEGLLLSRTRAVAFFPDADTAYAIARETIAGLSISNFSRTVRLERDVADVYGVRMDGRGWYIKLTVREDEHVVMISFHPLARALRTKQGKVNP